MNIFRMAYKPKYSDGEILVSFKEGFGDSKESVQNFCCKLGYQISDENYKHGKLYIIKTEAGKEREAIRHFEDCPEFTDWADRRDIRLESRWGYLEQILVVTKGLHENPELPKNQYDQRIDEIDAVIKKLKKT